MPNTTPFDVLLFDLGGVLIELSGIDRMLELCGRRLSVDELWARWMVSEAVRRFETGRAHPEEFAAAVLAEFGMTIGAGQFLEEFTLWPQGPIPGSVDLLQRLSGAYRLACLTNTNSLHWARVCGEMDLARHFHVTFASHLLGMLKPDADVFHHVVERLGCPPQRILFLDDNQLNVAAARAAGLAAYRAVGLGEARARLETLGVL